MLSPDVMATAQKMVFVVSDLEHQLYRRYPLRSSKTVLGAVDDRLHTILAMAVTDGVFHAENYRTEE